MRRCLGCTVLIERGSRCARCRAAYRPAVARHQLPAEAQVRDGHRCRVCHGTDRLEVHHIIAIAAGGAHTLANLITLCHDCHAATHHGNMMEIA